MSNNKISVGLRFLSIRNSYRSGGFTELWGQSVNFSAVRQAAPKEWSLLPPRANFYLFYPQKPLAPRPKTVSAKPDPVPDCAGRVNPAEIKGQILLDTKTEMCYISRRCR